MKSTILTAAAIAVLMTGGAYAGQKEGVVVDVEDVYLASPEIHYETQCYNQEVPVYGVRRGSAGDALAGAVIGGAIGNQFGGGDGKDAMTVLGAIVGMGVANQPRSGVVGYDYEQVCETVEVVTDVYSFSHYKVTYAVGNKLYYINTKESFYVGDFITVK